MVCIEAPEVRFEEIITLHNPGLVSMHNLDKRFLEICEPDSIVVVSAVASHPVMIGARIKEDKLVVQYTGVKCEVLTKQACPQLKGLFSWVGASAS